MRKRKVRGYVEIPVPIGDAGHSIRYAMTVADISLSGCLLKMDQSLKVRAPVRFSLPVGSGKSLELRGRVVREQGEPHGYDVSFDELAEEESKKLDRALGRAAGRRLRTPAGFRPTGFLSGSVDPPVAGTR
jgi:hypothetical protein